MVSSGINLLAIVLGSCVAVGCAQSSIGPLAVTDSRAAGDEIVIHGRVVDENGDPVPNVFVDLCRFLGDRVARSGTAFDGTFEIRHSAGDFDRWLFVAASPSHVEGSFLRVEVARWREVGDVALVVPNALRIEGTVLDARGAPMANVRVRAPFARGGRVFAREESIPFSSGSFPISGSATPVSTDLEAMTDTAGRFEIRDADPLYARALEFERRDGAMLRHAIALEDFRARDLMRVEAVYPEAFEKIVGRVTVNGIGCSTEVRWQGARLSGRVYSDADGGFEISQVEPGSVRVTIPESSGIPFLPNWPETSTSLRVEGGVEVPCRIEISTHGSIRGRIRTRDGAPIAHRKVCAVSGKSAAENDPDEDLQNFAESFAVTDAEGRFELEVKWLGVQYLVLLAESSGATGSRELAVKMADQDPVDILMP